VNWFVATGQRVLGDQLPQRGIVADRHRERSAHRRPSLLYYVPAATSSTTQEITGTSAAAFAHSTKAYQHVR
jgi:hypothetical protein